MPAVRFLQFYLRLLRVPSAILVHLLNDEQMEKLRKAKLQAEGTSELFLWDLSYYMGVVKSRE